MATGYTMTFSKVDGDVISAATFTTEFQLIDNAFHKTTGHNHDGTTDGGAAVSTLGDADYKNKVNIDTTNNEIEFYVEVGGTTTEQVKIIDGVLVPTTDNDIDLGSSSKEFKDLYIDGTANIDSLAADNATVSVAFTLSGTVSSNIIPTTNNTYNLGAIGTNWHYIFANSLFTDYCNVGSLIAQDGTTITLTDHIIPDTDDAYDLGSGSYRFNAGYFNGISASTVSTVLGDIAVLERSIGGTVSLNSHLIPQVADTYNLGSSSYKYGSVFAGMGYLVGLDNPTGGPTIDLHAGFLPGIDNTYVLGSLSRRFTEVHATGGVITVSDSRKKTNVRPFTQVEIQVSKELAKKINIFQYIDDLEKNKELAREHPGLIAQEVITVFIQNGLDPFKYSFISHNTEEDIYSFRLDELLVFITKGLSERISKLEEHLNYE